MLFQVLQLNSLRSCAVRDSNVFDVVPEQNHEDSLVVLAMPDGHNLGYISGLDVVLVIDLESFQPEQKITNLVYDLVFLDNQLDESIIFPHFQYIFEKDSQKIGSHISVLFLHMTGSFFDPWVLIWERLWLKLSFFFFWRNMPNYHILGHFGAEAVILPLWVEDILHGESWWEINAWV